MSYDVLFWLYFTNAVLIIDHEIDSAYWQEWRLFSPDGSMGAGAFIGLHLPMLALIMYGLSLIQAQSPAGLVLSLLLCAGGLFAFVFHAYHLKKGCAEFDTPASKALLVGTLLLSIIQSIVTVNLWMHG